MTIEVSIDLGYALTVRADAQQVFKTLSDVPTSASFFPKVDRLVDLGEGAYRWEMAKIGLPQVNLQTIYACRYASDAAQGRVQWTPLPDVGNAQVQGHWIITPKKSGTALEFHSRGVLTLPLPGLMKKIVGPLVEAEFEKLVEQYIDNLIAHFGGEV
ncbi:MAG: hypothetical protein OHK0048_15010 [Rhodoferax sp.]